MPDELTLIKQLQQHNDQALAGLYDKYSGALYGVILRICKDEATAQDLLQETFIKIWQKAKAYDPDKGRFYTWAYRIARNLALNSLRKSPQLIQQPELSVYINETEDAVTPIDISKLNGSIGALDAHHRQALELVYFNGLTHKEAHEVMDVPLGTFKSYIRQALTKLREAYGLSALMLLIMQV